MKNFKLKILLVLINLLFVFHNGNGKEIFKIKNNDKTFSIYKYNNGQTEGKIETFTKFGENVLIAKLLTTPSINTTG